MKKKRIIIVSSFLLIFAIYLFVSIRGEYLQMLGMGQEFVDVFNQNIKYKISIMLINFTMLYFAIYMTTVFIKKGLKKFFEQEKREMPKLPNKSISLIVAAIVSVVISGVIAEKALLRTK